jgi:hypothetical protein
MSNANLGRTSENATIRKILRDSWNPDTYGDNTRGITQFRAIYNLGDFLGRKDYNCGGPNPLNASKPGLKRKIGSLISNCDNTGVPGSSGNSKFVSDSSDYTRFRKERIFNKQYKDLK